MKLIYISLNLGIILSLFSSCTNHKAESTLLTDKQSCSVEECPSPQSKITGNLYIESDAGSYQLNVDKSDVIEIAGKCSDLGLRNHRILVELYEGEDVSRPNALIMENSASPNCVNSSTPSLNGQRCFWVTNGKGVVDSGTEYPQCFNGRFSFSVKLGRILRTNENGPLDPFSIADDTANPKRNYMVRFKIRANDGAVSESAWNSALIERGVTKPTFNLDARTFSSYQCDVMINAFKNLEDLSKITYQIKVTPEFIGPLIGTETELTLNPIIGIPYTEPVLSSDTMHVTKYRMNNLVPGVKYKVKVKAFEKKYTYSFFGGKTAEESAFSDEVTCLNQPRLVTRNSGTDIPGGACSDSGRKCQFTINPSLMGTYLFPGSLQWVVVKDKTDWAEDWEPASPLAPSCNAWQTSTEGCILETTSFGANPAPFYPQNYPNATCTSGTVNSYQGTYVFAVRVINPLGAEKSAWSVPNTDCKFQ